jgi:hypothetical protein
LAIAWSSSWGWIGHHHACTIDRGITARNWNLSILRLHGTRRHSLCLRSGLSGLSWRRLLHRHLLQWRWSLLQCLLLRSPSGALHGHPCWPLPRKLLRVLPRRRRPGIRRELPWVLELHGRAWTWLLPLHLRLRLKLARRTLHLHLNRSSLYSRGTLWLHVLRTAGRELLSIRLLRRPLEGTQKPLRALVLLFWFPLARLLSLPGSWS